MTCRDNSRVKLYWKKIKDTSKGVDIIGYSAFEKTYTDPNSEILYFDNGIFRVSNIIRGHKAELHGYIFSHHAFRELHKFRFMFKSVCEAFSLHRVECVVDKENKGLQKLLKMIDFKSEGIRENGVFLNGLCVDGIGYAYIR